MRRKRLLYVEDDQRQRDEVHEYFSKSGWYVETAQDGNQALEKLMSCPAYDIMILDLKMPGMNGEDLLEAIAEKDFAAPPIIILSAHLADEVIDKCRYLGAVHVLTKPYSAPDLVEISSLVMKGVSITNTPLHFGANTIDYMVRRREAALRDYLKQAVGSDSSAYARCEPVFIVGRRWNSWYPSVFPVPGGAYAVIAPRPATATEGSKSSGPGVVIDPGFRFLEVFRSLNISVASLECCIVTHNHPDHLGGIFEFMAARHALGKRTKAFFNPSVCHMLGNCSGFNLEVKEFGEKYVDIVHPYLTENGWLQVRAKAFDTFHEEIGRLNSSKGLILSLQIGESDTNMEEEADLIIVGDTEYDHAEHFEAIVPTVCRHNVKTVVLHIGSSQLRHSTGKHLYLKGLQDLLHDMDSQLRKARYPGKLLVAISEWGLEHATKTQLSTACGVSLRGFNDISPIRETIRLLQKEMKKIVILPADLGLVVGVRSGLIYFGDGSSKAAQELTFDVAATGIKYFAAPVSQS